VPPAAAAGTLAAPTSVAGQPAAGAGGMGGASPAAAAAGRTHGDVPCDAAGVLKQHCARCHGNNLREGAPMTLVNAAGFQRAWAGQTVGFAVVQRIHNESRPMPPAPAPRLTAVEAAPLEVWVNGGSMPAADGCSVDDTPVAETPTVGVVHTAGGAAPPTGSTAPPAEPDNAWPMFGGNLDNTRNNAAEHTLSPANVAQLKELWTFKGPSTTSTPAVVGGVIYLPGWDGKVYALRLEDGSSVWTASLPDLIDSSPTVTDTQVIVSDDNGSVHALDRTTGAVQWSHAVDTHAEAHLWSSPQVVPDASLVIVGVASGEEAVFSMMQTFRGSVVALDVATGQERWRFETASSQSGSGPGIAVWATPTIDTKRKLVYIGTGNNYAEPVGEYADSMLAINYETGKLAWSRQFTTGDVYTIMGAQGPDFDIGSTANLFTLDGRDTLGIGIKSGHYFALDRDTGETQWMTMLTPGSVLGGVISAPAYANGMVFVASNDFMKANTQTLALNAKDGAIVWKHESPNLTYGGLAHANGVVYLGTTAGSIFALDGAKGTALWVDQTADLQPIAGSPVVAEGKLLVPWGYTWTLREGETGMGGLTVYGL
jgi:polyvinyl alcohol dehydrogenase (cytochrome)